MSNSRRNFNRGRSSIPPDCRPHEHRRTGRGVTSAPLARLAGPPLRGPGGARGRRLLMRRRGLMIAHAERPAGGGASGPRLRVWGGPPSRGAERPVRTGSGSMGDFARRRTRPWTRACGGRENLIDHRPDDRDAEAGHPPILSRLLDVGVEATQGIGGALRGDGGRGGGQENGADHKESGCADHGGLGGLLVKGATICMRRAPPVTGAIGIRLDAQAPLRRLRLAD